MAIFRLSAPTTLFGKTAATIAIVLIVFQIFTSLVLAYYLLIPVAKRSADDLADFMLLSAKTWVALAPEARSAYQEELWKNSELILHPAKDSLPQSDIYLPYMLFLRDAISQRSGQEVRIASIKRDVAWYWIDVIANGHKLRFGFPEQHFNIHAPPAILLILLSGSTLTLLTTLILVRRLIRPLSRLAGAASKFGEGATAEPLPETGPSEIATLVRTFNQMTLRVNTLLANRTSLLAGIAHDLRTPIARMRLVVEMLPAGTEPDLVERMRRGLDDMNRLITQSLEFCRGLGNDPKQIADIGRFIEELIEDGPTDYQQINYSRGAPCEREVSLMALRRILVNLIDNALRYGEGRPVTVSYLCDPNSLVITVADRGQGIPADEMEAVFEPFYRVDKSRSSITGGSGLGLAIAKQLAGNSGWTLSLHARDGGGIEARLAI